MMVDRSLAQAIAFSSILMSGTALFAVVSISEVDWFLPSMLMIVASAIGWDRFVNSKRLDKPDS